MNVGLITTLNTNIGDDFIRLGIQRVLRSVFPEKRLRWVCLNKHHPESIWPAWHPLHWLPPWAPNWRQQARRLGASRFHGCDLIVQCGAPVIWDGCARCEWNKPIWQDIVGELRHRIPILNLAIGSTYALSAIPERISDAADREYIQSILSYCRLTTARDSLARQLVGELGFDIPLIPCSAGLAFDVPPPNTSSDTVFVNYRKKAGHYDFERDIHEADWDRVLKKVVGKMAQSFRVVLLCHNQEEMDWAAAQFPEYERTLPKSHEAYCKLAQQGRFGLFNRLHAAVAFAGMGIPSVVVGSDTRTLMVKEYGLPVLDVRHCTEEALEKSVFDLAAAVEEERGRLLALRESIQEQYIAQLQQRVDCS